MIILPAIDIKDGNCVRLVKGDYGTAHKVADSYMDTALGICFPSVTRFMELLDAIYKPDEKGNYIKVWEKKDGR